MDPFSELSHLRYSGKTDGRRHLAKFEKLVTQAYPNASEAAKWKLFTQTIDTHVMFTKDGSETPGHWLINLSKTESWQKNRLTYQNLKSIFLDRWSKISRDSPPPQGYRMLEDAHAPRSEPSTPISGFEIVKDPGRTNIEFEPTLQKQKNQVILQFPDLRKRKKRELRQISPLQTGMPSMNDGPPSPESSEFAEPEEHHPNEVIVVVNEAVSQHGSINQDPPSRPRLLEGKVCAITHASKGIGRAIALGMAKEGAHIVAHYWGTPGGSANDDIVSLCVDIRTLGRGCSIIFGDISDPKTSEQLVKRAVDTHGRLDIVVGNAGICWNGDFLEMTPDILTRHNDVNVNGNFYLCQAAARQMSKQATEAASDRPKADYSIICITSPNAFLGSAPKTPIYSTKSALHALMQTCTMSLGASGIRCNTIVPGTIDLGMTDDVESEKKTGFEKQVPLGRFGTAEDIVGPAMFLASSMAKYVTGTQIVVDGGSATSL